MAVPEIEEPGQHLGRVLRVEPEEVLVVALDENRPPRRGASVGEPRREVAGTVVCSCRPVDATRIRLNTEITHVKHPPKAFPEHLLEREDVVIHSVDGPVDVTGGAKQHIRGSPLLLSSIRREKRRLLVSTMPSSTTLVAKTPKRFRVLR